MWNCYQLQDGFPSSFECLLFVLKLPPSSNDGTNSLPRTHRGIPQLDISSELIIIIIAFIVLLKQLNRLFLRLDEL